MEDEEEHDNDNDDDDENGDDNQSDGPGTIRCLICNRKAENVGPRRGFDYKNNYCGGCVELSGSDDDDEDDDHNDNEEDNGYDGNDYVDDEISEGWEEDES